MEAPVLPKRIHIDHLDVMFHPGFYSYQECQAIMAQLENITYNSDEDSKVLIYGEKVSIPRKQTAFSDPGISYKFAGADVTGKPWPPFLAKIRDDMNKYLRDNGVLAPNSPDNLNYVLVNLYRDGNDYISAHRDNEPDMYDVKTMDSGGATETVIVSLSFGATRDFVFQRHDNSSIKYPMILQSGDLVIMRGGTNTYWKHGVPKRLKVKTSRYNLTFRFMRVPNTQDQTHEVSEKLKSLTGEPVKKAKK